MSEYRVVDGETFKKEVLLPCVEKAYQRAEEETKGLPSTSEESFLYGAELEDAILDVFNEEVFSDVGKTLSAYLYLNGYEDVLDTSEMFSDLLEVARAFIKQTYYKL